MLLNTADNATFTISDNPAVFNAGDFAGIYILRKSDDNDNTNNTILVAQNSAPQSVHRVAYNNGSGGRFDATVRGSNNATASAAIADWVDDGWGLVTVDYVVATKTLTIRARGSGMSAMTSGTATHAGTLVTVDAGVVMLYQGGSGEAFLGHFGIAYGSGTLSDAQFNTLYAALMTNGSVWNCYKTFAGLVTVAWHVGLVHTTGGGAKIGDAITTTNVQGRLTSGASQMAAHTVSGVTGTITVTSPFDYAPTGGWTRQLPATGLTTNPVNRTSPLIRRMGLNSGVGQINVLVPGNSRAVGRNDSDGGDGAFPGGLIANLLSDCAGDLWAGASTGTGSVRKWFLSNSGDAPATTGTVSDLDPSSPGTWSDWSRFSTGSAKSSNTGPGIGMRLADAATYTRGCFSTALNNGTITPSAQIVFRTYYLKTPVSSLLTFQDAKGTTQNGMATFGSSTNVSAYSTLTWDHEITASDAYDSGTKTITLDDGGTAATQINNHLSLYPNDRMCACGMQNSLTVADGWAAEIVSATDAGATSVIVLRHALGATPATGEYYYFGPVYLAYYESTFAADATNVWRGHKMTAAGDCFIIAHGAYTPGVGKYIVSGIGWGGHGFDDQLAEAGTDVHADIARLIDPDVVVVSLATQDGDASHQDDMTKELASGAPLAEYAWFGDGSHSSSSTTLANQTFTSQHQLILNNSAGNGVFGFTVMESPDIGEFGEQLTDGMREDTSHLSARGSQIVMGAALETMALALLGGGFRSRERTVGYARSR